MTAGAIAYDASQAPDPNEMLRFYERQQHATSATADQIKSMIDNTYSFVTARKDGELIGFARGVTDGLRGLLVECKLDPAYQGPACVTHIDGRIEHDEAGIARELALRVIEAFRSLGVERVDVLAYGTEEDFCKELGFRKASGLVPLQLDLRSDQPADSPAGVGAQTA